MLVFCQRSVSKMEDANLNMTKSNEQKRKKYGMQNIKHACPI